MKIDGSDVINVLNSRFIVGKFLVSLRTRPILNNLTMEAIPPTLPWPDTWRAQWMVSGMIVGRLKVRGLSGTSTMIPIKVPITTAKSNLFQESVGQ